MNTSTAKRIAHELTLFSEFDLFSIDDIIATLQVADDLYFNSEDTIFSDADYDAVKQYAYENAPNHSYFIGVGSEVRGSKVKLPYPMGSLTQAYLGDIEHWVVKHNLTNDDIIATEKLDGVSVLIVYDSTGKLQIAYSRGDGTNGADITRHISKIAAVPQQLPTRAAMVVRAEAIISKDNFPKIQSQVKTRGGQQYKNARNMMAGLMNSSTNDPIVYQFIDIVAYEILSPTDGDKTSQLTTLDAVCGFNVPEYQLLKGAGLNDHSLSALVQSMRENSAYEIDGIVLEVCDAERRKTINPTKDTLNPEYARKYKVADESNNAIATVIEVQWNISKDGYLKPRVKIEPIELVGVTVQHATGFNGKFIVENGIGPGAKIRITRSGDVIPFIVETIQRADSIQLPDVDYVWTDTGVDMVIVDKDDHDAVKYEQLLHFFSTIDVPALKEGNVQSLFDAGFKAPEDVITLMEQEMCAVIGSAIGKRVHAGIREKFSNIPEYVLMGAHPAFGRGVGVRKMKKLWEEFRGDMSMCANVDNILQVHGFEQKTADKIASGYHAYVVFCNKVSHLIEFEPFKQQATGPMTGQIVVFTGFRSKALEDTIIKLGGTMGSSVSSKTTLVVADDVNSSSGKVTKAHSLGVRVINMSQLQEIIDNGT